MNIRANRFLKDHLDCSCGYCRKEVQKQERRRDWEKDKARQKELSAKQKNLAELARKMKMDEPEEINKKLAIELVEVRKQLFNSEKQKTSASGKNEPGLKSLRQKFNPDLPNPSLKRLIAHCWQNIQDWKKEEENREKYERVKKLERKLKEV